MLPEVILLAGGSGRRMGTATPDKVLLAVAGRSLFRRGAEAFHAALGGFRLIVVARDDAQETLLREELRTLPETVDRVFVRGGAERGDSVQAGLTATLPGDQLVFIHDAARGLLAPESIRLVAAAAERDGAAVLAHPVTDTIKRIAAPGELAQTTLEDLDRRLLWAMETPQVFRRKAIVEAYASHGQGQTDDTAVYAAAGGRITVVHNPHPNPKLTVPADLPYFETLLQHPNFS